MRRILLSAVTLLAGSAALSPGVTCAAPDAGMVAVAVPLDQEQVINGVTVACTGIGQTKTDPHWLSFPVRVEFSNPNKDYLANEAVAILDKSGHTLAAASCEGPWILFKLPPGAYQAKGWLPGATNMPVTSSFHAPATGQLRLVLRFPVQ